MIKESSINSSVSSTTNATPSNETTHSASNTKKRSLISESDNKVTGKKSKPSNSSTSEIDTSGSVPWARDDFMMQKDHAKSNWDLDSD